MTHRPLYDNELFEIRIDRLVDKWSGSIEVSSIAIFLSTFDVREFQYEIHSSVEITPEAPSVVRG